MINPERFLSLYRELESTNALSTNDAEFLLTHRPDEIVRIQPAQQSWHLCLLAYRSGLRANLFDQLPAEFSRKLGFMNRLKNSAKCTLDEFIQVLFDDDFGDLLQDQDIILEAIGHKPEILTVMWDQAIFIPIDIYDEIIDILADAGKIDLMSCLDQITPEHHLRAVIKDPQAIIFIDQHTPEMCMEAVNRNPLNLQHVKIQSGAICRTAISKDPLTIRYAKPEFATNDLITLAMNRSVDLGLAEKFVSNYLSLQNINQSQKYRIIALISTLASLTPDEYPEDYIASVVKLALSMRANQPFEDGIANF